ncbi:MAG: acyl-CoA thioesterase [Thermoprotei archaeon]
MHEQNNLTTIRSTAVETLHIVNPGDANPLGILHGGKMMDWLVSTATLSATRITRGNCVLGYLDSVFFINPVHIGDRVFVDAWVEYVGRSSLEVAVKASAEGELSSKKALTTYSHMTFVAVDPRGEPRPIPFKLRPAPDEANFYRQAEDRYTKRKDLLADRKEKMMDIKPYAADSEWNFELSKIVFQDDAIYGDLMFGGRLLRLLDELTGSLAIKYCGGNTVTASVDEMAFYYPIRVGDILDVTVALNYVGHSSMEIGAKVIVENPYSGSRHHAATAYYTFVHIDSDGKPQPVPEYHPRTDDEVERWRQAEIRAKARKEKVEQFKKQVGDTARSVL